MVIVNYKHRFLIAGKEIVLTINYKDELWKSEITGETGIGTCSGGKYETLKEYIAEQEKQHRYSYNFFNHGHDNQKVSPTLN